MNEKVEGVNFRVRGTKGGSTENSKTHYASNEVVGKIITVLQLNESLNFRSILERKLKVHVLHMIRS